LTELEVARGHDVAHPPLTEDAFDPEFPGNYVSGADSGHGESVQVHARQIKKRRVAFAGGPDTSETGPDRDRPRKVRGIMASALRHGDRNRPRP